VDPLINVLTDNVPLATKPRKPKMTNAHRAAAAEYGFSGTSQTYPEQLTPEFIGRMEAL